ncbi:hypothetical protein SGFS_086120 [Streptomyces graminofaciens]|jgi:hypothetical protein|uniref:Lipoprotein n=1 Tax=Streptomyces graminofaciens TaxID=68212 RepID=A0ABM7FLW7_9ACTN|nr:hypothetical protein [Streptomyces graminofaciens]BBC37318.1 hypothetical protein SGFS_086120 [Streptomyces graminofaciens]
MALLTGVPATGCGKSGSPDSGSRAGSASPSPSATPPEEICTRLVAYWSRRTLTGDTYGDYQSTGLSDGQYEILREVVDAAREERKRAGRKAAERVIDTRAGALCEKRYRDGGPTGAPWG